MRREQLSLSTIATTTTKIVVISISFQPTYVPLDLYNLRKDILLK